ncbi:unnamed protein product [Nyctereutes procyonoides]|uniref:(raccoon dog) hypothetical protein n=1 Tax=Nyctereutes procyonoides TaxID=34880 RepID=A0A811Y9Z4_NYCPR|nr:unnamed protein product [Nyctereutes procyonoides]
MSKKAQRDGTVGICIIHTQAPASGLQQVANWVLLALGQKVWIANSGLPMDHNSDEHHQGRERNDMAVKKESVEKQAEGTGCIEKMNQLKEENEWLEAKIKLLTKELSVPLKDLFLEHAHNLADKVQSTSTENTTTSDNARQ